MSLNEIEIGKRRFRIRLGDYNNITIEEQSKGEKSTWINQRYFTKREALVRTLRDFALQEAVAGAGVMDLLDGVREMNRQLDMIEQHLRKFVANLELE